MEKLPRPHCQHCYGSGVAPHHGWFIACPYCFPPPQTYATTGTSQVVTDAAIVNRT